MDRAYSAMGGSHMERAFSKLGGLETAVSGLAVSRHATTEDLASLVERTDVFVCDCDGVLWRGETAIEGVPEALEALRRAGKKVFFASNNSSKSREGYVEKFVKLGIPVQAEEIYSSSYAAAAYLKGINFPHSQKVYVIGEAGLVEELEKAGFQCLGGPADNGKRVSSKEPLEWDHEVGAVVVGLDRDVSYYKMAIAQLCLRQNPGCLYIATNGNGRRLFIEGQEWPGAGAMMAALEKCSGREPVMIGKPSTFMLRDLCRTQDVAPHRMCMVGDRLETDILFGQSYGLQTLLVLSGASVERDVVAPTNSILPDLYTQGLSSLLPVLPK